MSQQPIVVGDDNITGNNLVNVGNRSYRIYNFFAVERDSLRLLQQRVAFDALLNAKERYPAPRCHPDTRQAVQDIVTDWICQKGAWAEKEIMWMSGAPGVGKSAILQTVCEALGGDDGSKSWLTKFGLSNRDVDASHFFGRGLGIREKASFFPATIAYQLSRSKTSCRDVIAKTIEKRPDIFSESFPSQFRELLTKTAKKRWSFKSPITIVIDALDECDNAEDQVELMKLILEAVTTTKTRFLIASRPEQQIHAFFQRDDVSRHTYHIRLDEESFSTSRDIEIFLRDEFARIRREKPDLCLPLPDGEDWPGNAVIIRIRDDSDSQFIFPVLVVGFIDTPFYPPNQQLVTLLAKPPPRAFSKLDALYERILSRCPPDLCEDSDELLAYQKLVKAILTVIITWSEPLSAAGIAEVLDKEVDVVLAIILGPMRSLFKFGVSKQNPLITLCHKSLRDYLLDVERSHRYFIPSDDADALFISILSRRPPSHRSYSRDDLKRVLAVMVIWPGGCSVPLIAEALDADRRRVQSVVLGATNALFREDADGNLRFIQLSTSSLDVFLHDRARSGEFFIQDEVDSVFLQILSRPPPYDSRHSYRRDDILDLLTAALVRDGPTTVGEIQESLLGVDVNIINRVLHGPARFLFGTSNGSIQLSTSLLRPFLQDVTRSGKFVIRGGSDAMFFRILLRQPPSDPSQSYSQEVLMGVLTAVVVMGSYSKVPQIAFALDVTPSLVEGVIFGSAMGLFKVDSLGEVDFSTPSFKAFLLDNARAGEYFVSSDKIDTLLTRILSCKSPADPSQSYSRESFMGVLTVLVVWPGWLSVSRIASSLDVDHAIVANIVSGPARSLFDVWRGDDVRLFPGVRTFLQDANRAGDFYIPPKDENTSYDSLLAQIVRAIR